MKDYRRTSVLVTLIFAMCCGCTVVPTRSESETSSSSESSSDAGIGGFLLGTLVVIGSIFLSDDDDDDCKCKDDDDGGITIRFD